MHLIMAVIQPTKLLTVQTALRDLGVHQLTVGDAMGYGRQRGQTARFRGNEYRIDLLRKITLEMVVSDQELDEVIATIRRASKTGSQGQIGDGKVFVMPIAQVIDIR